MRWLQTRAGERAHAFIGDVASDGTSLMICGMRIDGDTYDAGEDTKRCGNCDKEWRRRGREKKRAPKPNKVSKEIVYRPRYKFSEWDV